MKNLLLASVAALMLAGCGFRPLYADASFDQAGQGLITVDEINDRSGYLLRRELLKELAIGLPGLNERANLTVVLEEELERITLLNDGSVSRSFLKGVADFTLTTQGGQAFSGNAQVQVPISATQSPFGDVAAQTESSARAMRELAGEIVDDLRLQLESAQ
ncbi:MAG TPA: hypothetical protein EYG02_02480 [Henriciella marina]|uniref:LPS assembly lipoprotein LptE n=1 Tax=Henriciella sp. TaxID=1968823 RepID=UPI0017C95E7E|nr:LPS assembly lipoprotein LptE [Henriciella sp.]HIG22263.1 hypothetical protein [Henriciella sp.]HIK63878.1 hypothetical protein [Henriciella marina]